MKSPSTLGIEQSWRMIDGRGGDPCNEDVVMSGFFGGEVGENLGFCEEGGGGSGNG